MNRFLYVVTILVIPTYPFDGDYITKVTTFGTYQNFK